MADTTARLFSIASKGCSHRKFPMTAEANVTPIFQKAEEEELGKYRSIGLLQSLQRFHFCKPCPGT